MSQRGCWIDVALIGDSTTWSVTCLKVCSAGPRASPFRLFKTDQRQYSPQTHLKLALLNQPISPGVPQI